jgi:hypothetical protein
MVAPPLLAGAVKDTVARALADVAVTAVGAPGTVRGVTDAEGAEVKLEPRPLVATTVKVWGVPLARPDTTQLVGTTPSPSAVTEHEPDGEPVTVYPMIAEPPSEAPGCHATVTLPSPGSPDTEVGASGTARGTMTAEGSDAGLEPRTLVATTVKVYDSPLVRPDTTQVVAPEVVHVPVGEPATVYPVIAEPPSEVGACQVSTTWALPETPVTPPGVVGGPVGVADAGVDAGLDPRALVATTVKEYDVVLVRPETTQLVGTMPSPSAVTEHEPDGEPVTVYPVMADPPSEEGGSQATLTRVSSPVAVTPEGASGAPRGVSSTEALDDSLLPTALVATTVKMWGVPLARPDTTQVVGTMPSPPAVTVHDPDGEPVTVYPATGDPPSEAGGPQVTTTWASPATPSGAAGAAGMVPGTSGTEVAAGPVKSAALVAVTAKT